MKTVKSLFAGLVVSLLCIGAAQAAGLGVYGGGVLLGSQSLSTAGVQGGSGAALAGVAGTTANAGTISGGNASGVVTPTGAAVSQNSGTASTGGSTSGALGLATGLSGFTAGGASQSNAVGAFGTLGAFVYP